MDKTIQNKNQVIDYIGKQLEAMEELDRAYTKLELKILNENIDKPLNNNSINSLTTVHNLRLSNCRHIAQISTFGLEIEKK